jgi:hypothetical protein
MGIKDSLFLGYEFNIGKIRSRINYPQYYFSRFGRVYHVRNKYFKSLTVVSLRQRV